MNTAIKKKNNFSKNDIYPLIDGFDFFQLYNFANEAKLALSCNTSINIPEIDATIIHSP